jgi:hypothetical protein
MYLENLRFVELSNCSSPGLQWMWVRGRIAGPGLPVRNREVGRGRKRPPPPVDEFIDTADDDHHDGGGGVSIDIAVCEWHGACRECIRTGRLH